MAIFNQQAIFLRQELTNVIKKFIDEHNVPEVDTITLLQHILDNHKFSTHYHGMKTLEQAQQANKDPDGSSSV